MGGLTVPPELILMEVDAISSNGQLGKKRKYTKDSMMPIGLFTCTNLTLDADMQRGMLGIKAKRGLGVFCEENGSYYGVV
jgi:hypothetical protein